MKNRNSRGGKSMGMFDLTGKKAIVTGGSRGLGHGMAEGLMEAGCEVVIIGTRDSIEDRAKEFCEKGFTCTGVQADLGDEKALKAAFDESLAALGGHLDILVTAHGMQSRHPAEEFPMEDWRRVIDVNLTAVFELCQLAAKQFMAQKSKGKIITVSSMLTFFGGYTVPAYAASKGGVAQITKAFCNEWAEKGINVNSLAPGYMATEMNTALLDPSNPRKEAITNRIPAKKWGTPEDMKGPCVFLASEASDYLNGAIIPVDGGYLVR